MGSLSRALGRLGAGRGAGLGVGRGAGYSPARYGDAECELCISECTAPLVTTQQGQVCGRNVTDPAESSYHAYQGIPYARPPVGDLRFKVSMTTPYRAA